MIGTVERMLNNLSLTKRIIGLTALPLFFLALTGAVISWNAYSDTRTYQALSDLSQLAPGFSNVIHELQKERGQSAGFIGAKGSAEFTASLNAQRADTDSKLAALNGALDAFDMGAQDPAFEKKVAKSLSRLEELARTRADIAALNLEAAAMADWYSGTIAILLDVIKTMAGISEDAGLSREIASYVAFLEAKERAGQERAAAAPGFASGQLSELLLNRVIGLIAQQQAFLASFDGLATQEARDAYKRIVTGEPVDNVAKMREYVISRRGDVAGGPYSGPYWIGEITKKINLLKQVEDDLNMHLMERASGLAADARVTMTIALAVSLIGAGALSFCAYIVAQSVTRPLVSLADAMQSLSGGRLDVEVPCEGAKSELGLMAASLLSFKEGAEQREALEQAARADQVRRDERAAAVDSSIRSFDEEVLAAMSQLTENVAHLEGVAGTLSSVSEQTEQQSGMVTDIAERTSSNVQTVAAAAEEMDSSSREIMRQIKRSSEITQQAVDKAQNAVETVELLNAASQRIGEITSLIDEIAEQTNLLALNATIEAARAGEAGKGFAVVASEVKALATQTAKATADISTNVDEVRSVSERMVSVVADIQSVIRENMEIAASVTSATEQQSSATAEISTSANDAARGTQEVTQQISDVRASTGETREASKKVLGAAEGLSAARGSLEKTIQTFLQAIKAA